MCWVVVLDAAVTVQVPALVALTPAVIVEVIETGAVGADTALIAGVTYVVGVSAVTVTVVGCSCTVEVLTTCVVTCSRQSTPTALCPAFTAFWPT